MNGYHIIEADSPEDAEATAARAFFRKHIDMKEKPNCYNCIYRKSIPGDAHSVCCHPKANPDSNELNGISALTTILGKYMGVLFFRNNPLNVTGVEYGIDNGWFNWPWNFDPVWLLTCDGFTKREEETPEVK